MQTGAFVWHELMTTSPADAVPFYQQVVGWKTQAFDAGVDYTMWVNGEAPLGGLMPLTPELAQQQVPPHWTPYVGVQSVDEMVTLAASLGGQVVVPPTDIPNAGRFAVIADPQGAMLAVYQTSAEEQADTAGGPGQFEWHELTTTDFRAAFDFYSALFGWEAMAEHDMGPEFGSYFIFGKNGVQLGGMYNKLPMMGDVPPNWLSYARVPDVHAASEAVKRLGGQVLNGPMEVPGGDWIAQCLDPQGAAFALHQRMAPPPAA